MARQKKSKSAASEGEGSVPAGVRSLVVGLLVTLLLVGGGGWGYVRLREHVGRSLAVPTRAPAVVLKSRPAWMSDVLAGQIVESIRPRRLLSPLEQSMLREVAQALETNPWVRQVRQVRRVYGQAAGDTIEVDCEYRAPIALVATRTEYILVDGEGVRLPERFPKAQTPRVLYSSDGRVNIRIIDGVSAPAPRLDGQRWPGEDLVAGLDMVKFLYGRPVAEEIHRVNVANFQGRQNTREPQITLITARGSEIRWGEPIRAAFHAELGPYEKLDRLARIHQQFGRVDANHSWLDIRFDKITYPAEEAGVARAESR